MASNRAPQCCTIAQTDSQAARSTAHALHHAHAAACDSQFETLGCKCWHAGTAACPATAPLFCRQCTKDWAKPLGSGANRVQAVSATRAAPDACVRKQLGPSRCASPCACVADPPLSTVPAGSLATLPASHTQRQDAMATARNWSSSYMREMDLLYRAISRNTNNVSTSFFYSHHTWCAEETHSRLQQSCLRCTGVPPPQ